MITFGDKANFAINIQNQFDEDIDKLQASKMTRCHLIINDVIIGSPNEECYLPTWLFRLTDLKNRIADTKDYLFPKQFDSLTNREIFEIILKANQLEEQFNPDFNYLTQLDNTFWNNHHFTLDETIDNFLFFFYVRENEITFLIKNISEGINNDVFHFHSTNLDQFFHTIDETAKYLVTHKPFLKENVSFRTFNIS